MNRKLLILDVVLIALVIYAGIEFRNFRREARARQAAVLNRRLKPAAPPPYASPAPQAPVLAAGYAPIAEKMLFDKSRNPNVVIEVPPPPPPKPMPPLPIYHGQMNFGSEGPLAILSVGNDGSQKAVHPGETIGQFKLVAVNTSELTFEWDGQEIHKTVDELSALIASAPPPAAAAVADAGAPAPPPPPAKPGGGETNQFGTKPCVPGDASPDGTVVDGYRKTSRSTPFGPACLWEPVGR